MPALLNATDATATNATSQALQVVCAWPVSGQYGPGSRWLYYVLIAACVFARKAEWLRNACLAAALLFPAVAALHGITLAAVHVDGAVDMDIYGAFQLCSLGILAAPVTVRLSKTYFDAPGRNIIFGWTGLILSGLLSLVVEFFRVKTRDCDQLNDGTPVFFNLGNFTYGDAMCGLICVPGATGSPVSPLRGGSQDNIYVIPAPDKLTFGTATLLAAACCVPAILYLIFMWIKILELNWKIRWGHREENDELIEGTNGATVGAMKGINSLVSLFLSAVEVPLFAAAVLAILILGELNFFSQQLTYQSEPIRSVGQWAPIVGTGLAVLGSLYLLLAKDLEAVEAEEEKGTPTVHHHCTCSHHEVRRPSTDSSGSIAVHSVHTPDAAHLRRSTDARPSTDARYSNDMTHTLTHTTTQKSWATDAGSRRKVAKTLTAIGNYLGTAAPDRFDDSEFKSGKAVDFPEIPGEEHRNVALPQIREQFNPYRDAEGHASSMLREQRSRSGSFNSRLNVDAQSPTRSPSPRRSTLQVETSTVRTPSPRRRTLDTNSPTYRAPSPSPRRSTLEVPGQRHRPTLSSGSIVMQPESPRSPTVVVSSDDADDSYPPVFESPPSSPPLG